MAGDLFRTLAELGRQAAPAGAADARWVTRGTFDAARVTRTAELVLGFVDAAVVARDVPSGVVDGLMRALFDEQPTARTVRDAAGDVLRRAGRVVPRGPMTDTRRVPGRPGLGGRLPRIDPTDGGLPGIDPGLGGPPRGGPVDPPGPHDPDLPRDLIPWDKLVAVGCVHDLQTGLARLGALVAAVTRATPKKGARIDEVAPRVAAVGGRLTITGSGFGATRAPDVAVYLGRSRADVVSWGDTVVVVTVPAGADGDVCVSVLEGVDVGGSAAGDAIVQATEVGSIFGGCFGMTALGDRLAGGTAALLAPEAECGPTNHVWIGAPEITSLRVNGSSTSARVRPTDLVEVAWATRFADQVRLWGRVVGTTPAPASLAVAQAQVALSDTWRLPASGSRVPWEIEYVLTAANAAGTREASVRARGTFTQAMAFLGAGTRSVFHAGALEYLPRANPTAPAAVSATGLGALGALSAATGYGRVAPLVAAWDAISPAPVAPDPFNARAWEVMSHLLVEDSAVRGAFEAYENGMYVRLLRAVDAAINEAMLAYADAPVVGDLAIAITDDEAVLEGKVVDGLLESGCGSRSR